MSILAVTRRAALVGLGAIALSSTTARRRAMAQANTRFRSVEVDVSPLRASAGDPTAAWVAQDLPGDLVQALGGHFAPGDRAGATLLARIDYLYLGPSSGEPGLLGSTQDTIAGVLVVRGPRGGAEIPLRAITSYFPRAVDQPLFEEANRYRVAALAQAFAGWAPRELGL